MIDIKFNEEKHQSEAIDGGKVIGYSHFSKSEKIWIIDHTIVSQGYEGQGIARKLVDKIVENARNNNIKLAATCTYALKLFTTKDEYKDIFVG